MKELRGEFPNQLSLSILRCLGMPNNIDYVAAEVSHFFSYQNNLSVDKDIIGPCEIIVRDSGCTNTLFRMHCSDEQKQFVSKNIIAADLCVDDGSALFRNWQIQAEIQTNQSSFDLQIVFDVDIKTKAIQIVKSQYIVDEDIGVYMTKLALSLP